MIIYQILSMMLFPFVIFLGLLFSKKFRLYFLHRKTDLPKSTNIQPLWVHASSGEFEHAKFLIKSLKEKYPLQKIVVSYSSPSYFNAIKNFKEKSKLIDGYFPLPVDLKGPTSSIIKRVNPKAVLFSRTDVWPELAHQLKAKKTPTFVFARMEKSKTCFGEKLLYSLTYKKIDSISFVSEEDKENFIQKFNPLSKNNLSVDGDPRVEEVLSRALKTRAQAPVHSKILILGSVWSEDLKAIVPETLELLKNKSLEKVIIAPHEPSLKNINEIKKYFKDFSLSMFSEDPDLKAQVVIVDSLGVLFDLYSKAQVAFVGGSFKKKVHSVIEPLAHGIPVLTGPMVSNNREAQMYSKRTPAFVHLCHNGKGFSENLQRLLSLSEQGQKELSVSILENLNKSKGASSKITDLISKKVDLYI